MKDFKLNDFPFVSFDKIRYADTDRQGHVNNAVFSTYLETGRVEFLYDQKNPLFFGQSSFVIASLQINFKKEILWPGNVDIGTGIIRIGNSSVKIFQKLFQNNQCVADAETVIVQVDNATSTSITLSDDTKFRLQPYLIRTDS
ncbi:MAG: acyl-CoA thioesterase [Saprospiraceae bacterium]|nr:acyl-CoA thioesterase [Saprospiraceae bacterium]